MKEPMTTAEAISKHECSACKAGRPCEHNCVESETCSVRCNSCNDRVWFSGNIQDVPEKWTCPYCGREDKKEKHW